MEKRFVEKIEACRPGSDDLHAPEMADLADQVQQDPAARAHYERAQKWDAAIGAMMEQVKVPAGLAERILERLRDDVAPADAPVTKRDLGSALEPSALEASALEAGAGPNPTAVLSDRRTDLPDRRTDLLDRSTDSLAGAAADVSRRRWLAISSTLAAGLLLAAFLGTWLRSGDEQPLEAMADNWLQTLGAHWQDMEKSPAGFAVPAAVLGTPEGWQWISKGMTGRGVAYRLRDGQGRDVTLYAVRMARPELPAAPLARPQSTSGKAVGYWRSGDVVYVLVAPSEQSYREFVGTSQIPLA